MPRAPGVPWAEATATIMASRCEAGGGEQFLLPEKEES